MTIGESYQLSSLARFVGTERGASDWTLVDQARIQAFADCTGDQQWIHTDPDRCRTESPFGSPIAHGMLTLSMVAGLVMTSGALPSDASQVINAGLNNVRFRAPVRVGSQIRARFRLASAELKSGGRVLLTLTAVLDVKDQQEPGLSADFMVLLMP